MTSLASLIYKNILIGLSSNEIANDQRHTIARSFITIQDLKLQTTQKLLAYQFYINLIRLKIS